MNVKLLLDINSLAPGRCDSNFYMVVFERILLIEFFNMSCYISHGRIPENSVDDKSVLDQVIAGCRQAWTNYMNPGYFTLAAIDLKP